MQTFKNFKIQFGDNTDVQRKDIHKYSIYMQSRDSNWLNKNIKNRNYEDDVQEPIEEDIRD